MAIRLRASLIAGGLIAGGLLLGLGACATEGGPGTPAQAQTASPQTASGDKASGTSSTKPLPRGLDASTNPDPFPTTYQPLPSRLTAIVGANILTATGLEIDGGTIVMEGGKIVAVGKDVAVPAGATIIEAKGRWVTPGVIDAHSHLGVYPSPAVSSRSDGNEATDPNTAYVWAEHSIWPQDPGFNRARAGGVTTLEILPGSANLFEIGRAHV